MRCRYKILDLSYDGWFVQHDLWAIQELVNYTQADYLSMDIETLVLTLFLSLTHTHTRSLSLSLSLSVRERARACVRGV